MNLILLNLNCARRPLPEAPTFRYDFRKELNLQNKIVKLRPAKVQDADLLFEWRNDPETRRASHNTKKIQRGEHISWLNNYLKNQNNLIFVAEVNGIPVGTVRAELSEGVYELSWAVAPNVRGQGIAKQMVALLAAQIHGPIRAEVKKGNTTSERIARYVGMEFERESKGVHHYRRKSLKELTD